MEIQSRDIILLIGGLMANIFSAYLFSLRLISLTALIIIISSFIVIALIIAIQLKIKELSEEFENQKLGQKRLAEKLKIHEILIEVKADIRALQKEVFEKHG